MLVPYCVVLTPSALSERMRCEEQTHPQPLPHPSNQNSILECTFAPTSFYPPAPVDFSRLSQLSPLHVSPLSSSTLFALQAAHLLLSTNREKRKPVLSTSAPIYKILSVANTCLQIHSLYTCTTPYKWFMRLNILVVMARCVGGGECEMSCGHILAGVFAFKHV